MTKLIRWTAGLLLLLAATAAGVNFYLRSLLPDYQGRLRIEGLRAPAKVYFDAYAVPHIYAENEADAYCALGFVHAQERLFQMDLMRRAAKGELSALLGEATLDSDRLFRLLGVRQLAAQQAQRQLAQRDTPFAQAFMAYLQGVNAYVATGKSSLEHRLLGVSEVPPFAPDDVYAIGALLGFGFAEGFRNEPLAAYIQQLGPAYLAEVLEQQPGGYAIATHPDTATAQAMAAAFRQSIDALPLPLWRGSNGWAIGPQRTAAGKAILANDTHMGYSQPCVWFEAHLEYPGNSFTGLHAAGIPFGLIGRNDHLAWGLTMFENDDTDFFREKINPDNPMEVWHDGAWVPLEVREEAIAVKDADTVRLPVRLTPRGPILSDLGHLPWKKVSEAPISVWWSFAKTDIRSLRGWYQMAQARGLGELEEGVALLDAPGLNVMAADAQGHIGWWAAARLFERPAGANPRLILDPGQEPGRFLGFEANPRAIDPPWGFIYSANNRPDSLMGGHIPGYYYADHRAKAIVDALSAKNDWTAADVQAMQADDRSERKRELARAMLHWVPDSVWQADSLRLQAHAALMGWGGGHGLQEVGPTVYYKFQYYLLQELLGDELGPDWLAAFIRTPLLLQSLPGMLAREGSVWWDDRRTEGAERPEDIAARAFARAVDTLRVRWGDHPEDWAWGRVHAIKHGHPLGKVELLDRFLSIGEQPVPGGREVINNIGFALDAEGAYVSHYGPAMRFVVDFSEPKHSWNVLPTGQSGHVLSPHYRDQAALYNAGGHRLQLRQRTDIEAQAKGCLELGPAE